MQAVRISVGHCLHNAARCQCPQSRLSGSLRVNLEFCRQHRHLRGQTSQHRYKHPSLVMNMATRQHQTWQDDTRSVVVITTLGCPYCKRAKDALQEAGVTYEEVEAGSQLNLLQKIKSSTGKRTVPQVPLRCSLCSNVMSVKQPRTPQLYLMCWPTCRYLLEDNCWEAVMTFYSSFSTIDYQMCYTVRKASQPYQQICKLLLMKPEKLAPPAALQLSRHQALAQISTSNWKSLLSTCRVRRATPCQGE